MKQKCPTCGRHHKLDFGPLCRRCPVCGKRHKHGKCRRCYKRPARAEPKYRCLCQICWQEERERARAAAAERQDWRRFKAYLDRDPRYAETIVLWRDKAAGYFRYHGRLHLTALFPEDVAALNGKFKGRLIDLNRFCPGYTRAQVKALKAHLLEANRLAEK